jgi:hypothetical protein
MRVGQWIDSGDQSLTFSAFFHDKDVDLFLHQQVSTPSPLTAK